MPRINEVVEMEKIEGTYSSRAVSLFNKMPNKYNEYTSNHIIDYSASWMGTTRLFAYLGEWLVSNYIVTKFNQNSIKYLHKHDYLTN